MVGHNPPSGDTCGSERESRFSHFVRPRCSWSVAEGGVRAHFGASCLFFAGYSAALSANKFVVSKDVILFLPPPTTFLSPEERLFKARPRGAGSSSGWQDLLLLLHALRRSLRFRCYTLRHLHSLSVHGVEATSSGAAPDSAFGTCRGSSSSSSSSCPSKKCRLNPSRWISSSTAVRAMRP